jgi:hypothetical protein
VPLDLHGGDLGVTVDHVGDLLEQGVGVGQDVGAVRLEVHLPA